MSEINENVMIDDSSITTSITAITPQCSTPPVSETYIPSLQDTNIQNTEVQLFTATPTPNVSIIPIPDSTVTPTSNVTVTHIPDSTVTPTSNVTVTPTSNVTVTHIPDSTVTPIFSTSAEPAPSVTVTSTPSISSDNEGPTLEVIPTVTPSVTDSATQNQEVTTFAPEPTAFYVSSEPSIIKYTGKENITINIGKIYSAISAYVIPRNYLLSNIFGVFNDNNNYTSDDFTYFNIMKTKDSNIEYSYCISLKTSPNLYPNPDDETLAETTYEIPNKYINQYKQCTYTWNSIRIIPKLINNGPDDDIICREIDSPIFEVRQKQNNIALPKSYNISFYGNTTINEYNIGPVLIEPINSYSDIVIAKITKVSENNILSFSGDETSILIKRGEQILVKQNNTSNSGWAYITITSGDTILTPSFANPISYTCIVNLNYLGSNKPVSPGGGGGGGVKPPQPTPPTPGETTPPTPTPSPTPSSSNPDNNGLWVEIDGTRYYSSDIHETIGDDPSNVSITCSSDVTYTTEKSAVGNFYYVGVISKASGTTLFVVTVTTKRI